MENGKHYRVIVIGGGPAGVTAALRVSELGGQVALVERGTLGGTCTNDGCAPTRVLAKAARLVRDVDQFDSYGIQAIERPTVDFGQLIARAQSMVYRLHEKKQLRSHLEAAGVSVFLNAGSAHFVDEHTLKLGDGTQLTADRFIIAAGGHGRRIPFPGSELALTHEDVWRLKKIPRSLAIVGGAATGSQLASIFSAFGVEVSLFEVSPRILAREDHQVGEVMQKAFVASGIHVVTGISGIDSIEQTPLGMVFRYTKDGQTYEHPAEAVFLAVGWVGNLEALNLDAAGVKTERGYIVVDDYLRSSNPHIYAAGDITGRMMLVQSGSHEGRVAAENAMLGDGMPYKHLTVPHGGFTDPEYACVGLTEEQARKQEPDCVVTVVNYDEMDRALIDDLTTGFCKLIVSQETHRILGAAVVGEQAVEIAQMIATGMAADMWVEQLSELELAYPTYTAIVGLAARRIIRQLGVMPLSEQWRTLGLEHTAEWERNDGD